MSTGARTALRVIDGGGSAARREDVQVWVSWTLLLAFVVGFWYVAVRLVTALWGALPG